MALDTCDAGPVAFLKATWVVLRGRQRQEHPDPSAPKPHGNVPKAGLDPALFRANVLGVGMRAACQATVASPAPRTY